MISVESPLIKELVQESSRDALQAALLRLLQAKFADVSEEILAKIPSVQDLERLQQLLTHAGVCTDLDSFRARLAE